jgi:hypothetical protein
MIHVMLASRFHVGSLAPRVIGVVYLLRTAK